MRKTAFFLLALASPLLAEDASPKAAPDGAGKYFKPLVIPTSPAGDITIESPPAGAVNLLRNGDFEEANESGDGPAHWQRIDKLVFYWVKSPDPKHNHVLHIETDVGEGQAYDWWKKLIVHNAPLSEVPAKIHDASYGSVAGLDGGFYASDWFPIKKGAAYKVYIDAKGPGAKIMFRGYDKQVPLSFADEQPAIQEQFRLERGEANFTKEGKSRKYRLRYSYQRWFAAGGSEEWKTYTHFKPISPTGRELTENVRWGRIQIYPYWPPATYEFDNVVVIEVPPVANNGNPDNIDPADIEEGKIVKPTTPSNEAEKPAKPAK
jgi:hypothetical protein